MAHDKIYGICGDKCAVNITDLIVRARFVINVGVLAASRLEVKSIPLRSYGITSAENVNAIISPLTSLINDAGASRVEVNHYIADGGVLIVTIKNKTAEAIAGVKFNVAII